jgi:hypothetical protein
MHERSMLQFELLVKLVTSFFCIQLPSQPDINEDLPFMGRKNRIYTNTYNHYFAYVSVWLAQSVERPPTALTTQLGPGLIHGADRLTQPSIR